MYWDFDITIITRNTVHWMFVEENCDAYPRSTKMRPPLPLQGSDWLREAAAQTYSQEVVFAIDSQTASTTLATNFV
jgi:hypothetical protein